MIRRLLLVLALAASLLGTNLSRADATDFRCWPRNDTVTVYIGSGLSTWRVPRAMRSWNALSYAGSPRFVRTYNRSAANVRVWGYRSYLDGHWGAATCGHIRLNQVAPISYNRRAQTSVHEFGHVLGLGHRFSGWTVMRPNLYNAAWLPTESDRRHLAAMY
jgi:hypothetical protein